MARISRIACLMLLLPLLNSCSGPSDAYTFRCTEVGTDVSVGPYTKLAGTSFSLDAVALYNGAPLTRNLLEVNLLGLVSLSIGPNGLSLTLLGIPLLGTASKPTGVLDFVETTSQASCESGIAGISDLPSPVYPLSYDTLYSSTTSTSPIRQTVTGINIPNTHKTLMCRATVVYSGTTYRKCGAVTFATRPHHFDLASSNANADAAGASVTATPSYKSGTGTTAGTLFNLAATAKNAAGTTLTSYNGTPTVVSTGIAAHSGAVRAGTLSPSSFSAASSGVASGNFSYSEVGYFKVTSGGLRDDTYTATDQSSSRCISGSSSNTLSGGKYGCNAGSVVDSSYFGRFIPYGFVTTPVSASGTCNVASSTSTTTPYFGGEFTTTFYVRAANDALVTTQNYTYNAVAASNFAKFSQGSIGTTYANYQFQSVALTNPTSTATLSQGSAAPTFVSNWLSGQATVRATHRISRPTNPTLPQTLIIRALPTDTEASSPLAYLTTDSSKVADTGADSANLLTFRYGRLRLYNAYGAETMPLSYAVLAQYWNGTRWATNIADSCSQISANMLKMRFPVATKNQLFACDTSVSVQGAGKFSSGIASLRFSAPGNAHHGWVYVSLKQDAADTSASSCVSGAAVSAVVSNQSQFGYANSEEALVSFGQYKSRLIYSGEQ